MSRRKLEGVAAAGLSGFVLVMAVINYALKGAIPRSENPDKWHINFFKQ